MKILDYLSLSFAQLLKHPIRTLLTVTGIAIGIASMVTVLSVGDAGQERINSELDKFGINRVWIYSSVVSGQGSLTMSDVEAISSRISDIDEIAPVSSTNAVVTGDTGSVKTDIAGTTESLEVLEGMDMYKGRFLNENDISQHRRSIVLSKTVAKEIFKNGDALNKTVYINGCSFNVVGIRNDSGFINQFLSNRSYIPLELFFELFNTDVVDEITFTSEKLAKIEDMNTEAMEVMSERHGYSGIKSLNLSKELSQANNILDIFKGVLASIAAISLIVGGIGIMNVMLITVKERTREIGIKKAIGATNANIMGQFLTESLIYSLIGGTFGFLIGMLLTYLSGLIIDLDVAVSGVAIVLSFIFCAGVGLLFGVFPAIKAGKLDPVLALRS
ncbi:MAG: ABC transporter permease [Eubacteriales bacterium]